MKTFPDIFQIFFENLKFPWQTIKFPDYSLTLKKSNSLTFPSWVKPCYILQKFLSTQAFTFRDNPNIALYMFCVFSEHAFKNWHKVDSVHTRMIHIYNIVCLIKVHLKLSFLHNHDNHGLKSVDYSTMSTFAGAFTNPYNRVA